MNPWIKFYYQKWLLIKVLIEYSLINHIHSKKKVKDEEF